MRTPDDHGARMYSGDFRPAIMVLPPGGKTVQIKRPDPLPGGYPPSVGPNDTPPINNLTQSYGGT